MNLADTLILSFNVRHYFWKARNTRNTRFKIRGKKLYFWIKVVYVRFFLCITNLLKFNILQEPKLHLGRTSVNLCEDFIQKFKEIQNISLKGKRFKEKYFINQRWNMHLGNILHHNSFSSKQIKIDNASSIWHPSRLPL